MSSIKNKLNYINETKSLIKNAILEKNKSINNSTPFREYAKLISEIPTGIEDKTIPIPTTTTDINDWKFSKTDSNYIDITLPHTCNVDDAQSYKSAYRGLGYYKRTLTVTSEDLSYKWYLQLEQATMCANIYLNGNLIKYHSSGYCPCTVLLDGLIEGDNEIKVVTNNSQPNYDIVPISADFTFPNGLIGLAKLIKCKNIFVNPVEYGIDKVHITPTKIEEDYINYNVEFSLSNYSNNDAYIKVDIKDTDHPTINDYTTYIMVPKNSINTHVKLDSTINSPILWNGRKNSYLYPINIIISSLDNTIIDHIIIPYGFRDIKADHNGLILNGNRIQLWGAAVHQDNKEHMAAMTHEDYDNNYEIFDDVGMNYLRLAHYPHNVYDYQLADKFGYLTEVEIPWINNCPAQATDAFKEAIYQYARDMINNLYNHPSIGFWGLSNELGGNHEPIKSNALGGYDKDLASTINNNLFMYARTLDATRPIGCQTTAASVCLDFIGDWMAFNTYDKWYLDSSTQQTSVYNKLHTYFKYVDGISEYGAGGNPDQQSETWFEDEEKGSYGSLHYESYESYVHEFQIRAIQKLPSAGIVALWVFFDFPADQRKEGGSTGLNDKGLITRDRLLKKDVYYLYKAFWQKNNNINKPVCYIKDRRLSTRTSNMMEIQCYSNCDKLELYQGDILMQTLTSTPDETGVIWTFDSIQFYNQTDSITVKGYIDDNIVSTDTIELTTTSEDYLNRGPFITITPNKVECGKSKNLEGTITLLYNTPYTYSDLPDWITLDFSSQPVVQPNGLTSQQVLYTVTENLTEDIRTAEIIFTPEGGSPTPLNITQQNIDISSFDYIYTKNSGDYVNTGYIPTENTSIEAKFYIYNSSTKNVVPFGTRTSSDSTDRFYFYYSGSSGTSPNIINWMFGNKVVENGKVSYNPPSDNLYTLSANYDNIILNDIVIPITSTTPTFTTPVGPIFIFAGNQNNSVDSARLPLAGTKLYYFKIYESNELVHHYIASINPLDGIPKLYDKVTDKYIGSATSTSLAVDGSITLSPQSSSVTKDSGQIIVTIDSNTKVSVVDNSDDKTWYTYLLTTDLISGKQQITINYNENTTTDIRSIKLAISNNVTTVTYNLSQEEAFVYEQLEYISSENMYNTAPYILCDFKLSSNQRVEYKGAMGDYSSCLVGTSEFTNKSRISLLRNSSTKKWNAVVYSNQLNLLNYSSDEDSDSDTHTWEFITTDTEFNLKKDNEVVYTSDPFSVVFTSTYKLGLFCEYRAGAPSNYSGTRTLNYVKIYDTDNETLQHYIIPIKKSNGSIVMYDTIEDKQYTSPNGLEFIAGPVITQSK